MRGSALTVSFQRSHSQLQRRVGQASGNRPGRELDFELKGAARVSHGGLRALAADGGVSLATLLGALQRTAGNAAVQGMFTPVAGRAPSVQRQADGGSEPAEQEVPVPLDVLEVEGQPNEMEVEGGCDGLSLHGQANATYDGGRGQVIGQKVTTSGACADCGGQQCLHVTGTLVTNYSASVTITMPPMPDGLSQCEQGKVRAFLTNVLLPHEKDHEKRFKTYNGTTRNPIDVTGCGKADLQAQITAIQAAEDQQRQAGANALSGAIDPFTQAVDCSDCDDGG